MFYILKENFHAVDHFSQKCLLKVIKDTIKSKFTRYFYYALNSTAEKKNNICIFLYNRHQSQ